MLNKFIYWSKIKYPKKIKVLSFIPQAFIFIYLVPVSLHFFALILDNGFGLSGFISNPYNLYLGIPLIVSGLFFSLWTIIVQFRIGKGTPIPMIPTQRLVITAPYTYCRNPMGLGYGIALIGFGILFCSISYIFLSIIIFSLLLIYYKFIEEKELEERFGQEYIDYKKTVPFLIPRFRI